MITGVAGLFNATVVPGVAVVCAALLASSGASLRQGVRWTATASATALAVSAWWLVPFLHGWNRLIRWEVPLRDILSDRGKWQPIVLAVLAAAAAWSARNEPAERSGLVRNSGAKRLRVWVALQLWYSLPCPAPRAPSSRESQQPRLPVPSRSPSNWPSTQAGGRRHSPKPRLSLGGFTPTSSFPM